MHETAENMRAFLDAFTNTPELEYIDNAIEFAQKLAFSDILNIPMFNVLLDIRKSHLKYQGTPEERHKDVVLPDTGINEDPEDNEVGQILKQQHTQDAADVIQSTRTRQQQPHGNDSDNAIGRELVTTLERLPILGDASSIRSTRIEGAGSFDQENAQVDEGTWGVGDNPDLQGGEGTMKKPNESPLLSRAADSFSIYRRSKSIEDLERAIRETQQELTSMSPSHPSQASTLSDLGIMLMNRYQHSSFLGDLEDAMYVSTKATDIASMGHPYQPLALENLSNIFLTRYEALGDLVDLESAIKWMDEAIKATPPSSKSDRTARLSALGKRSLAKYRKSGNLEDFEQAIKHTRSAVAETPPSSQPDRASRLIDLSEIFLSKYEQLGALDDIEQAIKLAKDSIALTLPSKYDVRAPWMCSLGMMLRDKYHLCGDPEDLEQAIENIKGAIAITPVDHPNQLTWSSNLVSALYTRYERFRSLPELDQIINRAEELVAATPPNDEDLPVRVSTLGKMIHERSRRVGVVQDAEEAMSLCLKAVNLACPGYPSYTQVLNNLAWQFYARYKRLGAVVDLEEAIVRSEEVVKAAPTIHRDRPLWHSNLGAMLRSRYDNTGSPEDLEHAIKWTEKAISEAATGHGDRPSWLSDLGTMLYTKYERSASLNDLNIAIKRSEEAVASTPLRHRERASRLCNLGKALSSKYDRYGNARDLNKTIKSLEEAITAIPYKGPGQVPVLSHLAAMYQSRYDGFGSLEDNRKAMKRAEEAISIAPPDYPNRISWLVGLSTSLCVKYDTFGSLDDLDEAIDLAQQAAETAPLDGPKRAVAFSNLANMYFTRFERFYNQLDLERAIRENKVALAATPPNHPERVRKLRNMAEMFRNNYTKSRFLGDINQAIKYTEDAVAVAPANSLSLAACLVHAGTILLTRYEVSRSLDDIERVISLSQAAVKITPLNHPACAGRLIFLVAALSRKHEGFGVLEDLEQAIEQAEEVVKIPTANHQIAESLGILGNLKTRRYQLLGDPRDLDQAMKWTEGAVAATPLDDPTRSRTLINLAQSLSLRHQRTGSIADFHYLLRISHEARHCPMSPPQDRIDAAYSVALVLAGKRMWQESSSILEDAIRTLPKMTLEMPRGDQSYDLSRFYLLVSEAASIAIKAGEEASHCLKLLELGRGNIMDLALGCLGDTRRLQLAYPVVSEKFSRLRIEVHSPLARIEEYYHDYDSTYREKHAQRQKAIDELDKTLASIRELRGFEEFQLPPHSKRLMKVATDGAIIIFNCSTFRSDAIIVTKSSIKTLALPKLLYKPAQEWMRQLPRLVNGGRKTYRNRNRRFQELLAWLWDVAVYPTLKELQLDAEATDQNNLPRVWWIGTGPLSMAPFHAAGDHTPDSTRNTMSHVISSYIPTVQALHYARRRNLGLLTKPNPGVLLVTMPSTPGDDWAPLNGAAAEIKDITGSIEGKAVAGRLDSPSTAQVMDKLAAYDAIHFTCHSISDLANPSNSSLLLRRDNGSVSGELDRLTVQHISNTNLGHAQIAYLSTSHTAESASDACVGGSIYITHALQLAGFSHVLATQWTSSDEACSQVSRKFYNALFAAGPGGGQGGHGRVSASFHQAVRQLRDEYWKQPIKWAPFIHTGA